MGYTDLYNLTHLLIWAIGEAGSYTQSHFKKTKCQMTYEISSIFIKKEEKLWKPREFLETSHVDVWQNQYNIVK